MQPDVVRLRSIYLAGGCVWALHDALVGAWIAFIADVGTALVGAVVLFPVLGGVSLSHTLYSARASAYATSLRGRV
jgi:hypothetical protein